MHKEQNWFNHLYPGGNYMYRVLLRLKKNSYFLCEAFFSCVCFILISK
jgi:hypothetical protein